MNCELSDAQAGFRKGRETRDQIASIHWIIEKARVPEKHLLLPWPASWETYMQVRKQQSELDMEQQTGFKQEEEYIKVVYS